MSSTNTDDSLNLPYDYDTPKVLFPVGDMVVLPGFTFQLIISRADSIAAIRYAVEHHTDVVIATPKDTSKEQPTRRDFPTVATLCRILQAVNEPDNTLNVYFIGIERIKIAKVVSSRRYMRVMVQPYPIDEGDSAENANQYRQLQGWLNIIAQSNNKIHAQLLKGVKELNDFNQAASILAFHLPLPLDQRQAILEASTLTSKLTMLNEQIALYVGQIRLEQSLHEQAEHAMDKYQREFYLHEKLNVIQRELGDDEESENRELLEKIEAANMPQETLEHAQREYRKMTQLPPASPDRAVIATYLDWMVRYPWSKQTEDKTDLAQAQKQLDADHFGLQDVKERILDFIAVHALKPDHHGPILCLVGPPGVGKTSIGQSIARTLGREFNRTSLGGVHDEAEIRGHRRTYVGALPGRIIQSICNAGVNNPVLMLDEIDKLGKDYRGDPAAALLEALDPEQNREYRDHYIATPTDLSQVMFILTANVTDTIPPALLDRLEIIRIPGYTATEKLEIAQRYLLPRALENHGLKESQMPLSEDVLPTIIKEYTREAGVRNLEREIAKLCRKRVRQVVSTKRHQKKFRTLTQEEARAFLGVPRYSSDANPSWKDPGCVHGLSWTQSGGELLDIEVSIVPGRGKLLLTGSLGDVMKESARLAITWVRGELQRRGIKFEIYKHDVHLHVPEGAIPKDGPSAGITLASAVMSAITGQVVSSDLAMTGELSLLGRVLEVGGIKEKMLAAYTHGITTVYLPKGNAKDLEEIPDDIRAEMNFVFMERIAELFAVLFPETAR